jgi:sugar phosphate isomerase/epimerase
VTDARHNLGVTVSPLGDLHAAIAWASRSGLRGVQWGATEPGARPRDLGPSARRELRALLSRFELQCSGVDALVPPAHFSDPANVDRAVEAVAAACGLAADLGHAPVTVRLPEPDPASSTRKDAIAAIERAAERVGVVVADLSGGAGARWPPVGAAIDPAACLAAGADPVAAVAGAGARVAAVRVVDLSRDGVRGPVGDPRSGRVDVLAYRIAVESTGFGGMPVIDCRGWREPAAGVLASALAWARAVGHP